MMDRIRFQAAFGLCLFILSSCGGGGGGGGGSSVATQVVITPEQGNLIVGEARSFAAIAITSTGKEIEDVSFSWQSLDPTVASATADGVVTGNAIGVATIAVTGTYRSGSFTRTVSGSTSVGVVSPNPGGSNLTFSGKVEYQDKPYDINGFTGDLVPTPVRGVIINVIAIDGFATIATGATGPDGSFSFPNINNPSSRAGIYLQVVSKTEPNNPAQVEIRNNATDQALLSLISPGYDDSSGSDFTGLQMTATADSGIGGLFNILDVFSMASELIQQQGGLCKPPATTPCVPPLLVAYWEPGSAEGTVYDDQLDAIFILGGGDSEGDHDEYDDSVIAHEYGHFVVHHFSKDDSPGGPHFISDNGQDIRLSWSEGWGNFFSSAVRNNPVYLDTADGGGTFSFSIEDYSPQELGLNSLAVYTTSEIAVTGVLWDLFDDPSVLLLSLNESHDQIALGFGPIWQAIIRFPDDQPTTMETFSVQFMTLQPPSDADNLKAIMRERKMNLFPPEDDSHESNDEANGTRLDVTNNPTQSRTLYRNDPDPFGDEDIIPFSVGPGNYILETFDLTNGADTFLFITDSPTSSTPLNGWQNDNSNGQNYQNCGVNVLGISSCPDNNKTKLASSISFDWTGATTTLYAHVKRSDSAPPSSGRLGSYNIRLKNR
jgi:hypothetical protein